MSKTFAVLLSTLAYTACLHSEEMLQARFLRPYKVNDVFSLTASLLLREKEPEEPNRETHIHWQLDAQRRILEVDDKGIPTLTKITIDKFQRTATPDGLSQRQLLTEGKLVKLFRKPDGAINLTDDAGALLPAELESPLLQILADCVRNDAFEKSFGRAEPVKEKERWKIDENVAFGFWLGRTHEGSKLPKLDGSAEMYLERLSRTEYGRPNLAFVQYKGSKKDTTADGSARSLYLEFRQLYTLPENPDNPAIGVQRIERFSDTSTKDNRVSIRRVERELLVSHKPMTVAVTQDRGAHAVVLNNHFKLRERKEVRYSFSHQISDQDKAKKITPRSKLSVSWTGSVLPLEFNESGALSAAELLFGRFSTPVGNNSELILPIGVLVRAAVQDGKLVFTPITPGLQLSEQNVAQLQMVFAPEFLPLFDYDQALGTSKTREIKSEWEPVDPALAGNLVGRNSVADYEGPKPVGKASMYAHGEGNYSMYSVNFKTDVFNKAAKTRDGKPLASHRIIISYTWDFIFGAPRSHKMALFMTNHVSLKTGAEAQEEIHSTSWVRTDAVTPKILNEAPAKKFTVILQEIPEKADVIEVVRQIRAFDGMGLKEARAIFDKVYHDKTPVVLGQNIAYDKGMATFLNFKYAGAMIVLKE